MSDAVIEGGAGDAIVGADGAFAENWTQGLPADIQGNEAFGNVSSLTDLATGYLKSQQPAEFGMDQYKGLFSDEERKEYGADLDKFEDPRSVYKSFREVQKMASRKGDIPKPDAGDEAWKEFWGKLGTPEDPSKYEFEGVEGLEIPEDYTQKIGAIAHKHNLTKAQAQGVYKDWLEMEKGLQSNMQSKADADFDKRVRRVSNQWGDARDDMDASVRNLIKHYGYEADTDAIISPEAMLLLGDIAKELDERGQVGTIFNSTKAGLDTQIQETEAELIKRMSEDPDDKAIDSLQAKLTDLRNRKGDWVK